MPSRTGHASRPKIGCPDSIFRTGMWMDDPELHLMDSGMGFLYQLAQLCIQAKIRRCDNKELRGMEEAALESRSALRMACL